MKRALTKEKNTLSLFLKKRLFGLIKVAIIFLINIQTPYALPGDTISVSTFALTDTLPEIEIRAFESARPLLEQASSISIVDEEDWEAFDQRSISSALNSRAGVGVEERAPASYRINIRGSALRSPFGVRNVKVYWNDIPFTTAEGTTDLNMLDLSLMDRAEIIKGPASSIYGAGNGGVLLLSNAPKSEEHLQVNASTGSFGKNRVGLHWNHHLENAQLTAQYARFQSDGHRDHSASERSVYRFSTTFFPSANHRWGLHLLHSDLHYQIPGGLTESQFLENPQQARFGSEEQNSSIRQKNFLAGINHKIEWGTGWQNRSTLSLSTREFDHPFILDYKRELATDMAARTVFTYNTQWGRLPLRVVAGGEIQRGKNSAQNFANRQGIRDSLRFADEITAVQGFLFQQLELELTEDLIATFSLSQNRLSYQLNRYANPLENFTFEIERDFSTVWMPRFSLSWKINPHTAVFGSLSSGFSPPTLDEFRTNEGSVNRDLEAETGLNTEIGFRYHNPDRGIELNLSGFYFRLDETITSFTNPDGVVLFRNAGATDQPGLEISLSYPVISSASSFFPKLSLNHQYTGHFFSFSELERNGQDLSGNQLTGVSPHVLYNQLKLEWPFSLQFYISHSYADRLPLNDENTVYQNSRNTFSAMAVGSFALTDNLAIQIQGGVDNITDEIYSLGNDLNAFGGRYYQPAPSRNWFLGASLRMTSGGK